LAFVVECVDIGLELEKSSNNGGRGDTFAASALGDNRAAVDPIEAGVTVDDRVERGLLVLVGFIRRQAVSGDEVADDGSRHDMRKDHGRAEIIFYQRVGAADLRVQAGSKRIPSLKKAMEWHIARAQESLLEASPGFVLRWLSSQ
jgi:hypothetical protein